MKDQEAQTKLTGSDTTFNRYIFPIILVLIGGLGGLLLQKFVLSESPELAYSINESSPINVANKQYFPVTFEIANSGETPLEDVVLSASFEDKIVSAGAQPRLSKEGKLLYFHPASFTNTLEKTFDLAVEERHWITIVAEGAFIKEQFLLKSNEVMGELVEIARKREDTYLQMVGSVLGGLSLLLVIILVWMAYSARERSLAQLEELAMVLHLQRSKLKQELEKVEEAVDKREEEMRDLKTKLNAYESEKNQS